MRKGIGVIIRTHKGDTHGRNGKALFHSADGAAAFIDRLVMSGSYASASEVVRDGLRALQDRNAAVERWLREDVASTYDRWKADPSRAISSEEIAERMRKRHEERLKAGK